MGENLTTYRRNSRKYHTNYIIILAIWVVGYDTIFVCVPR